MVWSFTSSCGIILIFKERSACWTVQRLLITVQGRIFTTEDALNTTRRDHSIA
jgi:hypothetical protein